MNAARCWAGKHIVTESIQYLGTDDLMNEVRNNAGTMIPGKEQV